MQADREERADEQEAEAALGDAEGKQQAALCIDEVCQAKTRLTFKVQDPGDVVHCTTDGSAPTKSSPICTDGIEVLLKHTVVRAIAEGSRNGGKEEASKVAESSPIDVVCFQPRMKLGTSKASAPEDSRSSDLYIIPAQWDSTVYYTTDGSMPSTSSQRYRRGTPIPIVKSPTIVSAIEVAKECSESPAEVRFVYPGNNPAADAVHDSKSDEGVLSVCGEDCKACQNDLHAWLQCEDKKRQELGH